MSAPSLTILMNRLDPSLYGDEINMQHPLGIFAVNIPAIAIASASINGVKLDLSADDWTLFQELKGTSTLAHRSGGAQAATGPVVTALNHSAMLGLIAMGGHGWMTCEEAALKLMVVVDRSRLPPERLPDFIHARVELRRFRDEEMYAHWDILPQMLSDRFTLVNLGPSAAYREGRTDELLSYKDHREAELRQEAEYLARRR